MSARALALALLLIALVPLPVAARDVASSPAPTDFVMEFFPHIDREAEFFNDYGSSRPGGRRHKGNDIFSPKGTEIVAIADGFVRWMGEWPRAGYHVVIRHAGGWESHYYHLDNDTPGTDDGRGGAETAFAPGLKEGDFVFAGQVIGYVGDSGNAEHTAPHTHFELHDANGAVNPFRYLYAAIERETLMAELHRRGNPLD